MTRRNMVVLLLLIMPLLSGCWSRMEVNDLAFVTAAGIDKMENGKIRLALQMAIPRILGPAGQGGSGSSQGIATKAVWVVSEKGENIMDTYRKLQEKLPRKISFSHNRIIVIGGKLAQKGVSPVLDFFTRERESRLRSNIVFTKGEALNILKFNPKFEKVPSEVMREEQKAQTGLNINLRDFVGMLAAEKVGPVAAEMEIVPSNVKRGGESPEMQSAEKEETNLKALGSAVFKHDRLIGWMDDKETRGLLLLLDQVKSSVVTVNIPKDKGGGKVSVQVLNSKTKITPILKNGELNLQVKVKADDDLYENSSKIEISDPKLVQYIEKKLEDDIKQRIQLTVEKGQKKFKSDIFGFGTAVYRRYPKEWKNRLKERWDDEFPKVKVTVTANVSVLRTGLTNQSLIWEEAEIKTK
jgi:spore germination protein KC